MKCLSSQLPDILPTRYIFPPGPAVCGSSHTLTGPISRASVNAPDLFQHPREVIRVGERGGVDDRYLVRVGEIRQSPRIIKQAFENLPEGRWRRRVRSRSSRISCNGVLLLNGPNIDSARCWKYTRACENRQRGGKEEWICRVEFRLLRRLAVKSLTTRASSAMS